MALIAALSGSRRHSSARPALSQPRCTGRDIHSPKSREVKFSRRDGVRPPVGLRRKGSKPAIASHKNCRRAGVHGKSWWLFKKSRRGRDATAPGLAISALRARPDQNMIVGVLAFDQVCEDRSGEARVVETHAQVVAAVL